MMDIGETNAVINVVPVNIITYVTKQMDTVPLDVLLVMKEILAVKVSI